MKNSIHSQKKKKKKDLSHIEKKKNSRKEGEEGMI